MHFPRNLFLRMSELIPYPELYLSQVPFSYKSEKNSKTIHACYQSNVQTCFVGEWCFFRRCRCSWCNRLWCTCTVFGADGMFSILPMSGLTVRRRFSVFVPSEGPLRDAPTEWYNDFISLPRS